MSLETYFYRLCQEHSATLVEFVPDDARSDTQMPSGVTLRQPPLKQRPSFHSTCERLSAAPKRPSRTQSSDRLAALAHAGEALAVVGLSFCEGEEVPQSSRILRDSAFTLQEPLFTYSTEIPEIH
jgi:hypothetical protein